MKLFPVKRSPRVGETGISSRVPSCKRDGTPCVSGEGERRRIHIYIRMEKNLIPRQYKLLIMRPAFTCLLIGPPCLLGKIERSHDRPSLTPNAPRARHGPVLAALFLSLSLFLSPSFPARCRSLLRVYGHAGSRSTRRWTSFQPRLFWLSKSGSGDRLFVDPSLVDRSLHDDPLVLGLLFGFVVARKEAGLYTKDYNYFDYCEFF